MDADLTAVLDQAAADLAARAERDGVQLDHDTLRFVAIDSVQHAMVCAENTPDADALERLHLVGLAAYYAAQLSCLLGDDELRDAIYALSQAYQP